MPDPTFGVVMIRLGRRAREEAALCRTSLERHHDWPVHTFDGTDVDPVGARSIKTRLASLSPFDHTLYLDADTRCLGKLDLYRQALVAGWELVITATHDQGPLWLGKLPPEDKAATDLTAPGVQAFRTGAFAFRKTPAVAALFEAWHEEWQRFHGFDRGALLRALVRAPVKLLPLDHRYWNGATADRLRHQPGRLPQPRHHA
ncbi:hypothetical protein [Zavarzinia sp. CC-PAN008]|uniref:hypothetical protein n=1 Tax=Zavarzinia sp. CC-PAN008 TaxID=3243332 RepID=UPI003F749CF1